MERLTRLVDRSDSSLELALLRSGLGDAPASGEGKARTLAALGIGIGVAAATVSASAAASSAAASSTVAMTGAATTTTAAAAKVGITGTALGLSWLPIAKLLGVSVIGTVAVAGTVALVSPGSLPFAALGSPSGGSAPGQARGGGPVPRSPEPPARGSSAAGASTPEADPAAGLALVPLLASALPEAPNGPRLRPTQAPSSESPGPEPEDREGREASVGTNPSASAAFPDLSPAEVRSRQLAEEVSALNRARAVAGSGNGRAALLLLDAFARRYPHSSLTPEAFVVRVQATLATGNREEALRLVEGSCPEDRSGAFCKRLRELVGARAP